MRRAVALVIAGSLLLVTLLTGPVPSGPAPAAAAAPPAVSFAGRTWTVKTSAGTVGPGPNLFRASNVSVDGATGHLRLSITKEGRKWTCAEVILNETLGYGTYSWTLGTDVSNLDAQAVLGLFTWNDDPAYNHREIDFEAARWGDRRARTNAQWVVQPYSTAGNLVRFSIGSTVPTVVRFTWAPTSVHFQTVVGGNVVQDWTYTGADVPVPGGENARMNLWLHQGKPPRNGAPVTVVLQDFSFTAPV